MSEPEGAQERRADGIPPEALPEGVTEREIEVLEAMQVPTQRIIAIGLVLWLVALAVTLLVPVLALLAPYAYARSRRARLSGGHA